MKALLVLSFAVFTGCSLVPGNEYIPGTLNNASRNMTQSVASINEAKAGLLTDYRQCLKEASNVDRQKDCAVYQQALLQLQVTQR
jgi:hypothetical protein